jgi:hypothetical protein
MKPHIYFRKGVWCCIWRGRLAYGYTPRHAWEEWSKQ